MSLEQYNEVVNFVHKHHNFWKVEDENILKVNGANFRLHINYITSVYDSRYNQIWSIKLNDLLFRSNHFTYIENKENIKYTNLFDWVMAYLKGEWSDRTIINLIYQSKEI